MATCELFEKSDAIAQAKGGETLATTERELIEEAVNLLADGMYVWQVSDQMGIGRGQVANIKALNYGRILGMQRERAGRAVDGSPKDVSTPDLSVQRIRTFYAGPHMRISLDRRSPDDATIRVALRTEWTDAALTRLCRAMSRMSAKRLDALAARIREEGTR